MSPEDQKEWETEEMNKPIDLEGTNIKIDPSPFQVIEYATFKANMKFVIYTRINITRVI